MLSGYALVLRGQLGATSRHVWFVRATVDELSVDLVTELMDGRSLYLLVTGCATLSVRRLDPSTPIDLRPFLTVDLGPTTRITFDGEGKPRDDGLDPQGSLAQAVLQDAHDDVAVTMDWNQIAVPPLSAPPLNPDQTIELDGRVLRYGANVMTPTA